MELVDFETPLAKWMRENDISAYEVAKRARISYKQVCKLRDGESLPSLITAFRIDQVTKGMVAPVLWLTTALGKRAWSQTHDWEKWQAQRKEEQRRNRARTAEAAAAKLEAAHSDPLPIPVE